MYYVRNSLALFPASNSDPGSHSGTFSPLPTTVRAFIFIGRKFSIFFPRGLASNCAYPRRYEGTLNSWSFFFLVHDDNHANKIPYNIFDDLGLRGPVIYKPFQMKRAPPIVARVQTQACLAHSDCTREQHNTPLHRDTHYGNTESGIPKFC